MKTIFKILAALSIILLLTSCGTARKAERNQKQEQEQEQEVQQDTLPPTHPPVVVPHTWRDA